MPLVDRSTRAASRGARPEDLKTGRLEDRQGRVRWMNAVFDRWCGVWCGVAVFGFIVGFTGRIWSGSSGSPFFVSHINSLRSPMSPRHKDPCCNMSVLVDACWSLDPKHVTATSSNAWLWVHVFCIFVPRDPTKMSCAKCKHETPH